MIDSLPRFGTNVILRRLSVSDLAAFQAYRDDPDLGRYQGWSAMSDADARAFLEAMNSTPLFRAGDWAQIGIAAPDSATLVGDIGLYLAQDERHAEIGFTLSRQVQGRGLATAAVREAIQLIFESTDVQRVQGITDARNLASIRLLERVRMHKREERISVFRGEECVEFVYALERVREPGVSREPGMS